MSEGQKQGVGLFAILVAVAAIALIVGILYNGYRLYSYVTPPSDQADLVSGSRPAVEAPDDDVIDESDDADEDAADVLGDDAAPDDEDDVPDDLEDIEPDDDADE